MYRLWRKFASMRRLTYIVALTGLAMGVLIIAQAQTLAVIVDRVYRHHGTMTTVSSLLTVLLAVIFLRALVSGLSETLSLNLATRTQVTLREQMVKHLFAAGPLALASHDTGALISTAVQGIDDLEVFLARYLPQVMTTAIVPALIFVRVISRDWLSGVILLVTLPLIPFFMILIGKYTEGKTTRQWGALSQLNGHFLDILAGLETLKMFGRSKSQAEGISLASESFRRRTMSTLRVAFLSGLVLELLASLSMAVVAVAIGLRLISGAITFESAFMVLVLVPDFYSPWRSLGAKFHDSLRGLSALEQLDSIVEAPTWACGSGSRMLDSVGPWGIHTHNLSFTYPSRIEPTLQGISVDVAAGQHLAIVGPSGSGKSTLVTLLLGLGPYEGSLRIDDVELTHIDMAWWRDRVTWINQHPYLFYGTLEDNLRIAKPNADEKDFLVALEKADADDLLANLPQGLKSHLGQEGRRLSAGERQRIALARAFLRNTPMVVFDEPTQNLDPVSEEALESAINRLTVGRTAISIAHRLTTIMRADHILVLNRGQVEQMGSVHELANQPGAFRDALNQFEGGVGREVVAAR